MTAYFPDNVIAHINVNWLSPVKVRTTLIGGEKKMLVWNDLEADEKIKVYDRGVQMTSREGVYDLLVSYRSGDMWAPQVEATEALKAELAYFVDCIENGETPFNDGMAGLRVVQDARSGRGVLESERGGGLRVNDFRCIAADVKLGKNVKLAQFVNLYGCEIGDDTKIGAFVEIQKNARVGAKCKISSHTFVCEGVTIEDNVFVGHDVTFINDMLSAGDNCRRRVANGKRLESGDDSDEEGRLDRIRRDDPRERDDRRKRDRWRRAASLRKTSPPIRSWPEIRLECCEARVYCRRAGNDDRAMNIPFLDLVTPHAELKEELCEVFDTALDTAGFIGGPMVQGFEQDFAKFCDAEHCVGVGSGTDALRFALDRRGHRGRATSSITVPNTFIATTEAISQAGARPAFVDIDERTYNIDPEKLREYLETACDVDADRDG